MNNWAATRIAGETTLKATSLVPRILDEVFVFLCDQGGCLLLGTGSEKLRLEIALYFWVQIESLSFATAALLFSLVLFTLLFIQLCVFQVPEDERWGVLFLQQHIQPETRHTCLLYGALMVEK